MAKWTLEEWSRKGHDVDKFHDDLVRGKFSVLGYSNGMPLFDDPDKVDWERIQDIADGLHKTSKAKETPQAVPESIPETITHARRGRPPKK
jgi:hypothetical protein